MNYLADMYRKNEDGTKTEKYKRSNQKTGWKTHGMKLYEGETWDQIYDIYYVILVIS